MERSGDAGGVWTGQEGRFPSECAFYRSALRHLRRALPTLPQREQFNRLQRGYRNAIAAFNLFLVDQMQAQRCLYEALDSSGIPTRDAKRRGTGWLAGQADIGWSNPWAGMRAFTCSVPSTRTESLPVLALLREVTHDQLLAETFFAARARPTPALLSVGSQAQGAYLADKGFAGEEPHTHWRERYGAEVITAPHRRSKQQWSKAALHNFCLWLNMQLGREPLAFAESLEW